MHGLASAIVRDEAVARHFSVEAEIAAMLRFESELATAQARLGLIPEEAAETIAKAADRLSVDVTAIEIGMVRDGVPIPALVRALRAAVGEPHAEHVHLGATSQDAVDTGLMIRLQAVLGDLAARLDVVMAAFETLSGRAGRQPLMAQTRMQAALPFTVADKIATWQRPLRSHRARLSDLAGRLPLQLGGPVGDGASFGPRYPEVRVDLADRLGLGDAEPWHSNRTIVLDVAQCFALVAGALGKIGHDVALLAQTEMGAVTLAAAGGSSAMAHKRNPVAAEILVALARSNAGHLGTMAQSLVHENERSGAAWTLEWLVLPQMAVVAGAAIAHAATLLDGLEFTGR